MSTLDNRKSYFLSVTPVNYSLTEGTNIPPPTETLQPPTPGGGPLSSHPATPPESEKESIAEDTMSPTDTNNDRTYSFRTPTSPASAAQLSSSPNAQRPKGVRKLLSLTNLRASFSSSRTSLSQPRASNDTHPSYATNTNTSYKRPASPGATSSLAPSTVVSVTGGRPPLRQQKSGNWFKRKSSLFLLNGDLDTVEEAGRPDTRESKRLKEMSPAPLLPDIGALRGGSITGGDLGWDEKAFKRDLVT
jgi:hypothetical protein